MRRVLITRAQPEADDTALAVAAAGHKTIVAPLFRVRLLRPDFWAPLGAYAGILLTSRNAVRGFLNAFKPDPETLPPIFTVGRRTAALAEANGLAVAGNANGDARDLAALVAASPLLDVPGPLLHPGGTKVSPQLTATLSAAGYRVDSAATYSLDTYDSIPVAARRVLDERTVDAALFFSPRSADIFARVVRTSGLAEACRPVVGMCISAAVADRLAEGLPEMTDRLVAPHPSLNGLLSVLENRPPDAAPGRPIVIGSRSTDDGAEDGAETDIMVDKDASRSQATDAVIAAFGGLRPLAKALNITPSTVQGWKKRGAIPDNRHDAIKAAAEKGGVALEATLLAASAPAPEVDAAPKGSSAISTPSEAPGPKAGSVPGTGAPSSPPSSSVEKAAAVAASNPTSTRSTDPTKPAEKAEEVKPTITKDAGAGDASTKDGGTKDGGTKTDPSKTPLAKAGSGKSGDGKAEDAKPGPAKPSAKPADPEPPVSKGGTPPPTTTAKSGGGSGASLAVIALLVGAVGVASPWWSPFVVPPPGASDVEEDLSALEDRIEEIAGATGAGSDDLADRLAALEGAVADLPAGSIAGAEGVDPARLDALTEQVASLGERLTDLSAATEAADTGSGDLSAGITALDNELDTLADRLVGATETLGLLRTRIEALEAVSTADGSLRGAVGDLADRVDGLTAQTDGAVARLEDLASDVAAETAADTTTQAMMLAVGQLRSALDQGRAFIAPLTTLASVAGSEPALDEAVTMLMPVSTTGVKTRDQLIAEFPNIIGAVREAETIGDDAPWYLRALASLQELVTVRPAPGEVLGTDPDAILARAEGRLMRGSLEGAIEALSELEGRPLAAAAVWIAEARSRLDAEVALDRLTEAAIIRLGVEPPPAPASDTGEEG